MAEGFQRSVTFWTDAGGVGKTTMTSNVGDVLSSRGNDVLCIDLDPQHGGLTKFVGLERFRSNPDYNLLDVIFNDDRDLTDIILPSEKTGLSYDLLPSHEELENFSREITAKYPGNPLMVIRRLLVEAGLNDQYNYILVDVQGSRSQLVSNAIVATRNVIAPIELSEKGAGSIEKLESYIDRQEQDLNEERRTMGASEASLSLIGVVPYGLSHGTGNFASLSTDEKEGLYKLHLHEKPVTPFGIPQAAAVTESLSNKMTLREFIASDDHRDLRSSSCEQVIMQRFGEIADIVEQGSIKDLEGPYPTETVFTQYNGDVKDREREAEIAPALYSDQPSTAEPHSAGD